jgi:hypothetical protein
VTSSSGGSSGGGGGGGGSGSGSGSGRSDDAVQLKRWQIRCSLLSATPCALCLLALAVWRGAPGSRARSEPLAFELYFQANHAAEWLMAVVIIFTVMPLKKVALFARCRRRGGGGGSCCGRCARFCCCGRRCPCRSSLQYSYNDGGGDGDDKDSTPEAGCAEMMDTAIREEEEEDVEGGGDAAQPMPHQPMQAGARSAVTRLAQFPSAAKESFKNSFRTRETPVETVHTIDAL